VNAPRIARAAAVLAACALVWCVVGCPKTDQPAGDEPSPAKTAGKGSAEPAKASVKLPDPLPEGETVRIAMIPKLIGIDFFNACQKGAEEAAKEIGAGCELKYDGPTEAAAERQVQMIDGFVDQKYSVVAVACNDPDNVSASLLKALNGGIFTLTWDSDANPESSGRPFFVSQARPKDIGYALMDEMARQAGEDAAYAIVSGTHTAANQQIWQKYMKERREQQYPKMRELSVEHPGEDQAKATQAAEALIKRYPEMKGIFGITSVAFPAVTEAVVRAGKQKEIKAVGLATPKAMKDYVLKGDIESVILWNAVDLGYLTVYASYALAHGTLKPGDTKLEAGRLGEVAVEGDQIVLGPPLVFTKENIEQYDF